MRMRYSHGVIQVLPSVGPAVAETCDQGLDGRRTGSALSDGRAGPLGPAK